jgi:fimbrial chaperone protein
MRYQVTPYAWSQSPQGEMKLSPTEEVLLFPMLFTLAAGEKRIVRIGTTAAFAATEKTFRVVIDEFPSDATAPGVMLQVRSRVVLPLFLDPAAPVGTARVENAGVRASSLQVELRSTGNAHLLLSGVQATALDGAGAPLYERKWGPKYLLSGDSLQLTADAPKDLCGKVRSIRVEAQRAMAPDVRAEPLTRTVAAPGVCVR